MRRLILFAAVALSLSGCAAKDYVGAGAVAADTVLPAPAKVCGDRSTLDERLALATEGSYAAARTALEVGVTMGKVRGAQATKARALNVKAFGLVRKVRAAYDACNAESYVKAAGIATAAISDLLKTTGAGK